MVFATCFQIIIRNVFSFGFPGLDLILRVLVLWLALCGASIATSKKRHIAIDVLNKIVPNKIKYLTSIITGLFSVIICILLDEASINFILSEKQMGTEYVWGIEVWILQLILPFGFAMIGFKFLIYLLKDIEMLLKREG